MLALKAKHSESCPNLSFRENGTQSRLEPSTMRGQENSLRNARSHIGVSAMINKQELKREDPIHQSKRLEFKTRRGTDGYKREIADNLPHPKGPKSSNTSYEVVNPFLEKPTTALRPKLKTHKHAGQHSLELSDSSTRRLNLHYLEHDSPTKAGVVLGASGSNILNNKTLYPQRKHPYLSQYNVWGNQSCSEDYCGGRCKKSNLTLDIKNEPQQWMPKNQSNSDIRKEDWMRASPFPRPERFDQYKEQLQYRLKSRVQYSSFQPHIHGENSRYKGSNQHIRSRNPSSKPLASTSYASDQTQPSLVDIYADNKRINKRHTTRSNTRENSRHKCSNQDIRSRNPSKGLPLASTSYASDQIQPSLAEIDADYKLINERYTTHSNTQQQTTETRNWRTRMERLLQVIRERLRKAFSRQDRLNNS
ncbi:hypothetical protein TNIN_76131 [Trichonephila inaurata madagascariensis]|uniref:Uncharacterized protein n=1 Tax=Trichonephila inaurata madagascariensis TaxID=2747483 RepID=A0A8X6XE33_9ARAC|nr:hypothetical protein TNIN_76131 [Trichonephila inaurata madagascariensis]